ncbi:MAG: type II restriction enzyme [Candidatus Woesearchaeota archaeon]
MPKTEKDNRKRKVDKGWELIFEDRSVLDEINKKGFYTITSEEINSYNVSDARLMTKFDSESSLPYIFQKEKLNILPVKRGTYVIGQFKAYQPLKLNKDKNYPKKVEFPYWIQTIKPENLSSEAKVINCAYVAGMLNEILGEERLKPTVDGRMSTLTWDFKIDHVLTEEKIKLRNDRSQCQIDGGYEGLNQFSIIEAKNSVSDTFIVRQLYYPFRLWHEKLDGAKNINPVFLVFSNDIFHFLVYSFKDYKDYSSIELIRQNSFVIKEEPIKLIDIEELMEEVKFIEKEPQIPFPQADTFERVVEIAEILFRFDKPLTLEDISLEYDFAYRQAQYYSRACMYLNIAKDIRGAIELTGEGKQILALKKKPKYLSLAEKILQHKVFFKTLKTYLKTGEPPSKKYIFNNIMKKHKKILYKRGTGYLSDNTLYRRSSTVKQWIEWIVDLPNRVV